MRVWFTLLVAVAALGLGALFYLVTRVRRFSCLRRLAETHRGLSWLLATGAVGIPRYASCGHGSDGYVPSLTDIPPKWYSHSVPRHDSV